MLVMDFKNLCSYLLLFQILKLRNTEKDVCKQNSIMYSIGLQRVSPPPSVSLCHTPHFLGGIMKNQVLNKIACSVMKNFVVMLMFSIYNKYEEGKNFF
jgi:hypothetical protein